ncbi:hypothetical protein HBI34_087410 [Parastagonospora nodorum]|nr:hypothetical protein HBI34_087410 [Parastagonospora nodorum]
MGFTSKLSLALSLAGYSEAFFRMSCPGRVVRERIDPIVNPGAIAGHVHTVSGGAGFSMDMTYADARAAKCSSCTIKEDMSNYWTPQLYVHKKDGTYSPVPVVGDPRDVNGGMAVYYLQRPSPATENLTAFPEDFRMLAGDSGKRDVGANDLATKGISFNCLGANKPETNKIPDYPCPGGLRAQVFFPSCWNGKDLDTPDHKSHMSYPNSQHYDNGPCPAGFPIHTISIFYEILYDTALFADQWNGTQHPFVFANGDATGYGFHGDFFNGWDVPVLQKAIDTCTDASGSVEKCAVLTQFTGAETQACSIPTTVKETIDGNLSKLPGCNTPSFGPARATKETCDDAATLGAGTQNFLDLTSTLKWSYAGCGGDNIGDRAFLNASTGADDMTIQTCIAFCGARNLPYAGLEYGRECFCADKLDPRYAPKDGIMGNCNYKCAGDESGICGGWAAMSIYKKCADGDSCKNWDIKYVTPQASSSAAKVVASSTVGSSTAASSRVATSTILATVTKTLAAVTKTSAAATATATAARRHARQVSF